MGSAKQRHQGDNVESQATVREEKKKPKRHVRIIAPWLLTLRPEVKNGHALRRLEQPEGADLYKTDLVGIRFKNGVTFN